MNSLTSRKQTTPRQIMAWMPYDKVAGYLAANGWSEAEAESRGMCFEKVVGQNTFQVVVPFDRALRDYPIFMLQVLRNVAHSQSRDEVAVLRDLYNFGESQIGGKMRMGQTL